MLAPYITTDAGAGYILRYMYQPMLDIDFTTLKTTPVIAEAAPLVEKKSDSLITYTYTLRKEAQWDNGTPITAKDVEFTFKATLCPGIPNEQQKIYFKDVKDFILYPDNPLKLTIVTDRPYFLMESALSSLQIIPEYFYDKNHNLAGYTFNQLARHGDQYKDDDKVKAFVNEATLEKHKHEPEGCVGSGAYELKEWTANTRIVLKKKAKWWGTALAAEHPIFAANPDEIIFRTIKDQTAAMSALKKGDLDVYFSIKPKDYVELRDNKDYTDKFYYRTPDYLAYLGIGFNVQSPKLSDVKTRQAFARLCDVPSMINSIYYKLAQRVIGPIHPSMKSAYNDTLKPIDYNPEEARKLFAEAGWKDSNGNGTLDKMIDGKLTEFEVDFLINAGNDMRKGIASMLQEECRKVGIKLTINSQEWKNCLQKLKKHDFEIGFIGLISSPLGSDLSQTFHSLQTTNDGGNYMNYVSNDADKLLDSISVELNEDKRGEYFKRFQALLQKDMPMVFLFAQTERIAISKKFTDESTPGSLMRPGFDPASFRLPAASTDK